VYLDGTAATTDPAPDGINLISFADTPKNRDVTGNYGGLTLSWWGKENDQLHTTEADIIMNPARTFATDGAPTARDIQDIVSHELGHALGLDHTPFLAATMNHFGTTGQMLRRSLEPDDIAGLRALYGGDDEAAFGAIAGQVVTTGDVPVFGAHVAATDGDGIVRVGGITNPDGSFRIGDLPPGRYQLFAEPLDGPLTPEILWPAFRDPSRPVLRDFRTTFAGGNANPTMVSVDAGATSAVDPIRVEAQPAGINPRFIAWSPDGRSFQTSASVAVQTEAGRTRFLAVVGEGLASVPPTGFSISGSDFVIDPTRLVRGVSTNGMPYVILPLAIRSGARPGARSLNVTGRSERATLTGAVEVAPPS
jgi:hypothetical protein